MLRTHARVQKCIFTSSFFPDIDGDDEMVDRSTLCSNGMSKAAWRMHSTRDTFEIGRCVVVR